MTVNLPTYNISIMTACIFIAKIRRHTKVSVTMLSFFWEEYMNLKCKDNNRANTLQLLWSVHIS